MSLQASTEHQVASKFDCIASSRPEVYPFKFRNYLTGRDMNKVNLYELFQFGQMMRFFDRLTPQTKFAEIKVDCELASMWFDWLLKEESISTMDTRAEVIQLKAICDQFYKGDPTEVLGTSVAR